MQRRRTSYRPPSSECSSRTDTGLSWLEEQKALHCSSLSGSAPSVPPEHDNRRKSAASSLPFISKNDPKSLHLPLPVAAASHLQAFLLQTTLFSRHLRNPALFLLNPWVLSLLSLLQAPAGQHMNAAALVFTALSEYPCSKRYTSSRKGSCCSSNSSKSLTPWCIGLGTEAISLQIYYYRLRRKVRGMTYTSKGKTDGEEEETSNHSLLCMWPKETSQTWKDSQAFQSLGLLSDNMH